MDKETRLHVVMLSELPQVGDSTAARILARNRERGHGLATFFRLPEVVLRDDYELHADTIRRVCVECSDHQARCQWLLDRLAAAPGHVLFVGEEGYPAALAERLAPPPAAVYAIGDVGLLTHPSLAVLSSRTITEQSVAATLAVVQAAAAQGFTVVSGGMKTSYRIAAVAGRAAEAPRAIVLDRGIFAAFGAHLEQDRFGFGPGRGTLHPDRTLVLSPFRLMNHAAPHNGRRRDEVVAALADVIVAVHVRPGGEIERVCLAALDRGQCVLSWYGENAGLVAAGATVIEAKDLSELARYASR